MTGTVHKTIKTKSGYRAIRVETRRPCRGALAAATVSIQPPAISATIILEDSDVGKLAESVSRELRNRSNFPRHWYDGAIG